MGRSSEHGSVHGKIFSRRDPESADGELSASNGSMRTCRRMRRMAVPLVKALDVA